MASPPRVWTEPSAGMPAIEIIPAKNIGAGSSIWTMARDKLGRLFVGSQQLHVYNGQSWQLIEVANTPVVKSAAIGRNGEIWIGGYDQLGYVSEPAVGHFQFQSLLAHVPSDVGALGVIWACAPVGKVTYFITGDKLLRWDGSSFQATRYETGSRLFPVQLGSEWWFQHLESGLYQLTEAGPVLKVTANLLPNRGTMGLMRDEEGLLVMNDWGYFRPGRPTPVSSEKINQQLLQLKVSSFALLPDGAQAIGTLNGGIVVLNPALEPESAWSVESGVPERNISAFQFDEVDRLVVGTTHALFHFPINGNPTYFGKLNGLVGSISSVLAWQGRIWITTEEGVFRQRAGFPAPGSSGFEKVDLLTDHYWFLESSGPDLLLGKHGGMDVFDGQAMRLAYEITANGAHVLMPSRVNPGRVYVSELSGVAILQRAPDGSYVREPLVDLPSACASLHEDTTGRLWLGTLTKGAFTYDPRTKALTALRHTDQGAADDGAAVIAADSRGITLLAAGRIFRANPDGSGLHRVPNTPAFKPVATKPVPGTDDVLVVFDLPWPAPEINHGLGILSFDDQQQARWRVLDLPSIATIDSIRALAFTEESSRKLLWVGGGRGLLRYDFDALRELSAPSAPLLRLGSLPPTRIPTPDDLAFAFKNHRVGINLFAGSFLHSRNWQFQTRLGSGNGEWSAPSTLRSFEFSNLSEGDYHFEARTVNPEGMTSETATFAFTILPPWYRSGVAYAGYAAGLALAVFGFVRIRERQIRVRNQELEALVEVRTAELVKASAAKDEFLAGVSHEIRNPMNGVIGIAESFKTESLDPEGRRKFSLLRQCAGHLSSLLEDILDFSKVQAGAIELDPKPFDLPELVQSIAAITGPDSEKYGIPVEIAVSPAVPRELVGDARRIRQILINFVSNALKFSGRGQVSVTVWCKSQSAALTEVTFAVSDEGPGITAEEQQRLFTRFERGAAAQKGRVPGTGLGLALCKGLAENMGGRIWLESEPGRGSCFYFRAPFAVVFDPVEAAPAAVHEAAAPRLALVVDDQEYNRIVLADLLQALDFSVQTAGDGESALELAAHRKFDVIFLDFNLSGLTGVDVARGIRALPNDSAHALILATTAFTTPEKRALCLNAGMDAFLSKPVTMERLRKALANATVPDKPPAGRQPAPADPLGNLRLLAGKKNVPLAEELALYFSELDAELEQLSATVAKEDAAGAGHYAHLLCGRCGFIYERELEQTLRKIERVVANQQWEDARRLDREFQAQLAGLRVRLASAAPAAPPA